ncbi:MAG: hypothetical protein RSD49_21270 [Hafnia sp.]
MKGSAKVAASDSGASGMMLLLFFSLFFAGCAQNPDIRMGRDHTSGTTAKSPPDYLVCVKDELPVGSKTYTLEQNGSVKFFLDSTDPNKATGLVEVKGSGTHHSFSAYQRDAWYDHGRLLDAALMCSKA